MKFRILLALLFGTTLLQAQSTFTIQRTLDWAEAPYRHALSNGDVIEQWRFTDCSFSDQAPTIPVFTTRFPLAGRATVQVELVSAQYEPLAWKSTSDASLLGADLQIQATVEQERNQYFGRIKFFPIRKAGSGYERLTSFTLQVRTRPVAEPVKPRGGPYTYTSVLSSGDVYKFGVSQSGVYKLDFNFLKNELGISNLESIDPRTIRLYGNGGAMLPEKTDDARADDLLENAIQVVGEQDGRFDNNDYILFYAVGPAPWTFRPGATDPQLTVRQHLYDHFAYYFIKTGDGQGLRIQEQASIAAANTTEVFDDVIRIEDEKVNLLDFFNSAQGSGKRWFGDYFYQTRERNYSLNFPNLVEGAEGRLRVEFAGRCRITTTLQVQTSTATFNRNISGVPVSNNEADFAANGLISGPFELPAGDNVSVTVRYLPSAESSEGWLDYLEVNARRRLVMTGQVMAFRDLQTVTQDATTFRLSGVNGNLTIWDVTDRQVPRAQLTETNGNVRAFGVATQGVLRDFIAFYNNADFPTPETTVGKITNQNIHGLDNLHMAIIYHPDFESAVQQLADHRRTYSGFDVATVQVDQLYNEFSSGAKDPTAIRDFARMLLERAPGKFDYLLLFGDGSFDPLNNTGSDDNRDFVPVFETYQSYSPITSFPSDDYFALLSDGEGGALDGALDIAVGRLIPRTPEEAQALVDKIIDYDSNPATLGDWHLRLLYFGDDEDSNAHINQADKLATAAENTEEWFNTEKIYFDAYQQVATSSEKRIPDAKAAINSNIFKGGLIAQYIGHGGPRGWAQERVIDNTDIAGWDNTNRYPLIITATCSFGGYDDYTTLTGGEQALLKVKSGAVALFTTVRAVYIDGNNKLTDAVQSVIFQRVSNGQYRAIGDILKDSKNTLSSGYEDNARRFTLLGDPAMFLAMPEYRVRTTRINGKDFNPLQPDTLRALMPVELEGEVADTMGNLLSSFNGRVYVTLFDKKQTLQTLGQDPGSPVRSFQVQRNILFKGRATVTNGRFKVNFVVPKDINYAFGNGKFSYYAEDGTPMDAAGADTEIIIGGTANLVQDDTPPLIQVFLNTDAFVFGGITDRNPRVLVKCADDYGMNVTGTSLGHDLTAVLDDNVLETIVLNDFYESEQDNAQKGQALYPLRNLAPGRHTLRVKGWDIANNSGEGYTEFVVSEDGKAALEHVLNYPNPFTTNTSFQFEHNLSGQLLDVQISIFSVSGKLVKTILHTTSADGYRVTDIAWDGKDEYGDNLARGVYLYRVKVRGTDVSGNTATVESDFEKLVILK
ncbi:MAG: type IX secretion system sortase PorU [Bacteroidetes bacterium]|nr:MAG: type IX secretion system sortase PorU [Bacteroidota bacterium]